jgi:hypothetical protein
LYQTIALKTDGTLWAWGYNNYGQLGLGTIGGNNYSPTQIGTDTDWLDVETGLYFGAALKASGEIYTWGRNDAGQLGTGNTIDNSSPVLVNCPTALDTQTFNAFKMQVYPNPIKDILTISADTEITTIAIYNLIGQQVFAKSINTNQDKIDVSSFQAGTYFVKVQANSDSKTFKIIKE